MNKPQVVLDFVQGQRVLLAVAREVCCGGYDMIFNVV